VRLLARRTVPMSMGGAAVAAFAVFWIVATWIVHARIQRFAGLFAVLPLAGFPFLIFGLIMAASPIWTARSARRTWYALTDQRAIVLRERSFGRGISVQSYEPNRLTAMERDEASDGSGDLIFEHFFTGNTDTQIGPASRVRRGFLGIDSVRAVEELVSTTLLSDGSNGS
jgi:hypothetical protein